METEIRPLSKQTIPDFLHFFDDVGFTDNPDWSACYCCFYHQEPSDGPWEKRTREQNRAAARHLIEAGRMKGLLACRDRKPVGWCNVNAKSAYPLLSTDPFLAGSEDGATTSIVCFLTAPGLRGQGIASGLLEAACVSAGAGGFRYVEAYPRKKAATSAAHYHGPISMYRKAGFVVHKENEDLWVVRRTV